MYKRKAAKILVWVVFLVYAAFLMVLAPRADRDPSIQPAMAWAVRIFVCMLVPLSAGAMGALRKKKKEE